MAVLATPSRALQIAAAARVVAVLGARTDASRTRPAFYVADFLSNDGVRVIPLPVSPPTGPSSEEGSFPGNAPPLPGGLAALASLPERVDVLCCFRRPEDLPSAEEIVAARPKVLWLQSGIRSPALEEAVAKASVAGSEEGIVVVADRCMKLDRAAAKASKM